ncbi:TPA: hypothetical protein DCL30_04070 [Candidatus Peribacteria bacterium]|nr:hypothetical protein [Candidatus Peribacteria bacterium]HAS34394.1 hypothetical protein [Candidatus Peribacteria bacterium]
MLSVLDAPHWHFILLSANHLTHRCMKNVLSKATFTIGIGSLIASIFIVSTGDAAWTFWKPWDSGADASSSSASSAAAAPIVRNQVMNQEEAIVQVVQEANPAVVSVIITKELPKMEQYFKSVPFGNDFGFPNDPFFRQFNIQVPQYRQNGTEKQEVGGGTAFFVTADGLLMTNKHVVEDETADYTVLLNDGRKLGAKVVARDPVNDIALLQVTGSDFAPLSITQSDELHLGQTAIAIGNALGEFSNTVSVGVVSGLKRSITAGGMLGGSTERLDQIIQTDAAINQGNSGGPLLDSRGEVIGMNTAVASGGQNVGFALPAYELRRVLESYRKNGRIVTPYLGVRYMPITPELKQKNSLSYDYGVLVIHGENADDLAIVPGSPADKAGIEENDIILEADGQKLTSAVSLSNLIRVKAPGDTITLKIVHKGTEKTLTVTLEERK